MRRVVQIQSSTATTRNAYGELIPSWTLKGIRRASRRGLGGVEKFLGQQIQADADYEFHFRQDEVTRNISGTYRLVEGSTVDGSATVYDVAQSVDPDGKGRDWTVRAKVRGV